MGMLDFLKDIQLEAVEDSPKASGLTKKQRRPEDDVLAIRIWKDGSVYPSKKLVDTFNLEYPVAAITEEEKENKKVRSYEFPSGTGNGLDVIDSRAWGMYKNDNPKQQFIAVAIVPKSEPKIDLFGSTKYNDKGTPLSSVLDQ